ncbi:response regulator transcription factor [Cohnella candidum]|uniref:Response regulator n=1 Tax=Cohnella candidum TaxID=2674991 RepID=A0A3G3K2H8_9BACL|nr:response regulator [Cohnella candidum]AYQ74696.1 response regulator [Cohnella candidum]
MYRVLIVEDEPLIREGFKRTIDWPSYGLEIVAEAMDGAEGLVLAERHRPHLIFADIRMPGMDGLAFAAKAAERLPEAKIVIVSGYKDYEYFRQSLQLGLFDYLLKPVEEEELHRVVVNAVQKLEEEQSERRKAIESDSRIQKSEGVLHAALLTRLTEGDLSPLRESAPDPYLKTIAREEYAVAVLRIDNFRRLAAGVYAGDEEALLFTAANICEESMGEGAVVFRQLNLRKQITIIRGFSGERKEAEWTEFQRRCGELVSNFERFGRFAVSLGTGTVHEGWEGIHLSYAEACVAAERTKFTDRSRVFRYEDVSKRDAAVPLLSSEFEEMLKSVCKQRDTDKLSLILDTLFRSPEAASATREQIYNASARIWALADQVGRSTGSADLADTVAYDRFAARLCDDPEELKEWLVRELRARFMKGPRVYTDSRALMHDLKDYVSRQFTSDEVSLAQLSAKFGMNIYQICRLFKQEFGVNFHVYLTELKMEKAKEYLRHSSMPVHDIAFLVGFKETKYFFKVFKKHVGLTPTEYRNHHKS